MRKVARSMLFAAPLLLMALAAPLATLADTAVSHSGRFGVHTLADSEEYPGVRCAYDDLVTIESVRVRAPFVYARDRHEGRVDSQVVSWKYRIQAEALKGWSTVATSDLQKRTATDEQVADFSPMRTSFDGSASTNYRVEVVIRWYAPSDGTTVVGKAVHRVDWYAWEGVPSFEGSCPGGLF